MEQSEPELSQDVVFDILSSPRRRYALYYLRTADGPIKLTTLAEQVAAWENDTEPDQITEQERKRVYVSLYQTHIPRLDESGIVEYDQDSGYVTLAEDAHQLDEYLKSSENSFSWQPIYLTLAIASLGLLVVVSFGVGPFGAISTGVVATLVILAFTATAALHTAYKYFNRNQTPEELQR